MAAVAASTTSLVAVTDPDGLVTWVNDGFWRTTGYELDEVRGRPIADFVAGAGAAAPARERIAQARARGGSLFGLEVLNVRKDGSRYWTELEVQPVHNRAARLTHWIYLQNDITHRKDAEAALADSAAYFRALFDDSPLAATIQDQERRLVRVNNAYAALVGYAMDELIGVDPFTLVHPEDRGYSEVFRAQVFAAPGLTHHFERRLVRKDGSAVWVRGHTVHHVPVGRPAYTIGLLEDITTLHAQQGSAARGQGARRGRQPRQVAVPGQHEPRDPHADERRARHDRAAARHAAHRAPAALRGVDVPLGRGAAGDHQRHPRLLEDRGRQARARARRVQPAHAGRGPDRPACAARRRQGHRAADAHRRARAGAAGRRPDAPAPGARQPAVQCAQVHRERRSPGQGLARRCGRLAAAGALRGQGHRHRHHARGAAAPVHRVHAGRPVDVAPLRRHRPRPGDHAPAGRAHGRPHPAESEAGRGSRFYFELPFEAGAGAAGGARRSASRAARGASSWSRTIRPTVRSSKDT